MNNPLLPASWTTNAACAGAHPDVDWFPDRDDHASTRAAKEICASCPVRVACLEHAIAAGERWGIWGGKTTAERSKLVRAKVDGPYAGIPHGTEGGYRRERRRGLDPCEPCNAANNEASRVRRYGDLSQAVGE